MAKYFRVVEIGANRFERMTGTYLDCSQMAVLADDGNVYDAVDDEVEDQIEVDIDMFAVDGGDQDV